jgi:hypothetical protein
MRVTKKQKTTSCIAANHSQWPHLSTTKLASPCIARQRAGHHDNFDIIDNASADPMWISVIPSNKPQVQSGIEFVQSGEPKEAKNNP